MVLGRLTTVSREKLAGWFVLVGSLAALSYAVNIWAEDDDTVDKNDLLYQWSSAVGGLIQYAIIFGLVLLIARGLAPEALGLRRPSSWRRAAGAVAVGLVAIFVIGAALNLILEAGKEQGLVPDEWDSSRAAPFVANFIVVAGIAPIVEELTYRGLGFAAVRDWLGAGAAVAITALAFGLAHGLVIALPVLTTFGIILALVRWRTDSVYPAIALHALFNAISLVAAVTVGST